MGHQAHIFPIIYLFMTLLVHTIKREYFSIMTGNSGEESFHCFRIKYRSKWTTIKLCSPAKILKTSTYKHNISNWPSMTHEYTIDVNKFHFVWPFTHLTHQATTYTIPPQPNKKVLSGKISHSLWIHFLMWLCHISSWCKTASFLQTVTVSHIIKSHQSHQKNSSFVKGCSTYRTQTM